MEEYFKKGMDYKSPNFYNEYVDKYNREIMQLLNEEPKKGNEIQLVKTLLNTIEIFVVKTKESVSSFGDNLEQQSDAEAGYNNIFKSLIHELSSCDKKMIADQSDHISIIMCQLATQKDTEFKFGSVYNIIQCLVQKKVNELLNANQVTKFVNSLKFRLNLKFYTIEKSEENDYQDKINRINYRICSSMRSSLEYYFNDFDEEGFKKNIHAIQDFYE